MVTALVTGANAGLGFETARQLAVDYGMDKVYLACRNPARAQAAKEELEKITGKKIFDIVIMDTGNQESSKKAAESLQGSVDIVILNAGGQFGMELTEDGVTKTFAVNLIGHVVFTEALLESGKLPAGGAVVYAASFAARDVPEMGIERMKLKESSVEEFKTVADGSIFKSEGQNMEQYGLIKLMGALWMATLSRKHPQVKFVTMSPGACHGTQGFANLPFFQRIIYGSAIKVMAWMGRAHGVETGAKRYIDAAVDDAYKTGVFYGSEKGVTGNVVDYEVFLPDLKDETIQENASTAIHSYIK